MRPIRLDHLSAEQLSALDELYPEVCIFLNSKVLSRLDFPVIGATRYWARGMVMPRRSKAVACSGVGRA
jgi:hypothetical protein